MDETYKYDVALSFAGEDRKYVEEVALFLKKKNIAVFYDYFEEEALWGKNLISYLEEIYTNKSKYCVVFISQYYVQKEWTCYESAAAMVRLLNSNMKQKDYLLPVKFDETKVSGVLSTIGFIDGKKKTPDELGNLIIKKLHTSDLKNSELMSIELFKNNLITVLSKDFPPYWVINCEETEQNMRFQYTYHDFLYYLEFVFQMEEKVLLLNGGYTDLFFDTHTFIPSAKITLNFENELISNGQIVNFDFFDDMNTYILPISEISGQIKKELLKKGGL
ncbi:toll/interleukin-1 receptor domain-containing protein [Agathobacter rectalis]|jgi:hypothetical protein|uniref:toll/interleukin-1 receptor domain-containing protein n=1 Tax=Agathobacter rectalis TaxID=39491 RepID=UPI0027D2F229|nr:TIR domain-containing protein [Agathobacter rectalis]